MGSNPVRSFALLVAAASVVAGIMCLGLFVPEALIGACIYGCEGNKPAPHDQTWVLLTATGALACGVLFLGAVTKAYSARPGPLSALSELRRRRALHVVWTAVVSMLFLIVGAKADLDRDATTAFACEIGLLVGVVATVAAVTAVYIARPARAPRAKVM